MPFGMVQFSPDTRIDNWDGSSGYHYSDSTIFGFSHTHLSGTGIPDYCDILFMPTLRRTEFYAKEGEKTENGYASKFSHENEKAEAGILFGQTRRRKYFCRNDSDKTSRFSSLHFSENPTNANIILDLKWRDKVLDSELKIVGNNRIEGFRRSKSLGKRSNRLFCR